MIDYGRKVIIVHPPRCGGSSVEQALLGADMWETQPWEKHKSAKQIKEFLELKQVQTDGFRWFGLTRHPVERVESMFAHGAWHRTVAQKTNRANAVTPCEFAALVKPLVHESGNLALFDFHGRADYPLVDVSKVDDLLGQLGVELAATRLEVVDQKRKVKFGTVARSIVLLRMWRDFVYYKYRLRLIDVLMLPLGLLLLAYYRLRHCAKQAFANMTL